MKTKLRYLLVVAALFGCVKETHAPDALTAISAVVDVTDPHTIYPDANSILSLFGFQWDENKAASFSLRAITDMQYNPSVVLHLEDGATTSHRNRLDNPQFRKWVVRGFYEQVRDTIAHFTAIHRAAKPMKHSEIYRAIASELQVLQASGAQQTYLMIHSDLAENSDVFNAYARPWPKPERLHKKLLAAHALPNNLTGIRVYFIYAPKNRLEDERYRFMVSVYTSLLESRGAEVVMQPYNALQYVTNKTGP